MTPTELNATIARQLARVGRVEVEGQILDVRTRWNTISGTIGDHNTAYAITGPRQVLAHLTTGDTVTVAGTVHLDRAARLTITATSVTKTGPPRTPTPPTTRPGSANRTTDWPKKVAIIAVVCPLEGTDGKTDFVTTLANRLSPHPALRMFPIRGYNRGRRNTCRM